MDERFGETLSETPLKDAFPPDTVEHHEDEVIPPVSEERKEEARKNLRERFPKLTDEDLKEVGKEATRTGKFELFIQKLMERYKWRRGVCQQQIGGGFDDIRDC